MAVAAGEEVEVAIEKPASGGRMIARHDGEILLVAGGIPGERVRVRVTRAEKRVAFAETIEVQHASPDRRPVAADPACGGCLYAHIMYPRQLQLKSDVIRDAFTRIGRIAVEQEIVVLGSPERGYRMRARLHVNGRQVGFYREGTHVLCDARLTGQLTEASVDAVEAAAASLAAQGVQADSIELSENLAADERAFHVEVRDQRLPDGALDRALNAAGAKGCTAGSRGTQYSAGEPLVSDRISALTAGRLSTGTLTRQPASFFQANRFLLGELVGSVMDEVPAGSVLDLYAGVGLFSIVLAEAKRGLVTAVEGDPISGADLLRNAARYDDTLRVVTDSVEAFVSRSRRTPPDTLIVDPPRTGMSKEAAGAITGMGAGRIVYVSCDAPTMARDARRVLDAGYRLLSLRGFDLFPNTPHVETLGVFER